MLTFDTLNNALTANITKLSLSAVCVQAGNLLIPIKGIKTSTSIRNVYVLPLSSISGEYIPVEPNWTLVINLSS